MCGIVAVLTRDATRETPSGSDVLAGLADARELFPAEPDVASLRERPLADAAMAVEAVDRLLRGTPGIRCLVSDPSAADALETELDSLDAFVARLEGALDEVGVEAGTQELEALNAQVVRLKDALWAIRNDRLGTARAVADLAGPDAPPSALDAFWSIQVALGAIDRLEVRGRDSAGVHVLVRDHGLDLDAGAVRDLLAERGGDPLMRSGSVVAADGHLCFVYKAAAEIGELGDNTRALRERIRDDAFLHRVLGAPTARVNVLGHTRWASVGLISEANAHPLTSQDGPYVAAALNGDIDNYADLKASEELDVPPEITTDAKVIPELTARRARDGVEVADAFRATVSAFEGSVAIAAQAASSPDRLFCALRGSGQALYVGLGPDAYVVASEPYGLVEQATRYLRMDGERTAVPDDPTSARGQVVALDATAAGTLEGIERRAYDGTPLPVAEEELVTPEITTRDIDRGPHRHFLIKEIAEAPTSFRKTLRGKIAERDGGLVPVLGPDVLPQSVTDRLSRGEIRRVIAVGQGTAAVASKAFVAAASGPLATRGITVEALAATELSGFGIREDMSDTLVVAVSQSGTTTDTLRTVEVARARGALVVSVVNRRGSDLTDRSDGVLYTSDGRDVEMAVPSTKAFYAQVAAGFLLAAALAEHAGAGADERRSEVLEALRRLPDAMEEVLEVRKEIARIAERHAPSRRYWAVVGNGPNRVAAEEVRIKLSELCYKSIACDLTEDKKHIDLSAEPMIVVCAAGLEGSNAEDTAKEIAIYRAHKAVPIVICSEGNHRFRDAVEVIGVPSVHPDVDFVLSAMAGHLFGYEAAVAIDAQALPLREARAALEESVKAGDETHEAFDRLARRLTEPARRFFDGLRSGEYNGNLEASTAVRLASLFRYATGAAPLAVYEIDHGKIGTPTTVVEDLADALTRGIDELTRPIDAIKHQAKTVTVGISRLEETLLQAALVRSTLDAGVPKDRLAYSTLRALAALDPAVDVFMGYTHYRIEADAEGEPTIHVTDKGGVAREIPSRTDRDPTLRGTKRRVTTERELLVARGRSDGRTVIIVPQIKGTEVTGLALLHVRFHDRLEAGVMRSVLQGYRDRYAALRDLVLETEPTFRDDRLAEMDVADLLVDSIQVLADRWRASAS